MKDKKVCPRCLGSGINFIENKYIRRGMVLKLHKEGFGLRKIQRIIGYKSPQSVSYIINKYIKKS